VIPRARDPGVVGDHVAARLIADAERPWSRDELMRLEDVDLIPVLLAAQQAGEDAPNDQPVVSGDQRRDAPN
jgi:hypothetical protein